MSETKTPEELKELGNQAFAEKDFTEAIKYYTEAIKLDKSKNSPEPLIAPDPVTHISPILSCSPSQSRVLFQSKVSAVFGPRRSFIVFGNYHLLMGYLPILNAVLHTEVWRSGRKRPMMQRNAFGSIQPLSKATID